MNYRVRVNYYPEDPAITPYNKVQTMQTNLELVRIQEIQFLHNSINRTEYIPLLSIHYSFLLLWRILLPHFIKHIYKTETRTIKMYHFPGRQAGMVGPGQKIFVISINQIKYLDITQRQRNDPVSSYRTSFFSVVLY